jgi:hypothetical protein
VTIGPCLLLGGFGRAARRCRSARPVGKMRVDFAPKKGSPVESEAISPANCAAAACSASRDGSSTTAPKLRAKTPGIDRNEPGEARCGFDAHASDWDEWARNPTLRGTRLPDILPMPDSLTPTPGGSASSDLARWPAPPLETPPQDILRSKVRSHRTENRRFGRWTKDGFDRAGALPPERHYVRPHESTCGQAACAGHPMSATHDIRSVLDVRFRR